MASFKWTVDPIQMPAFRRSKGPGPPRSEAAQPPATSEKARAAGIKEIERLIAQRAKDAALHKTVEFYGIDWSAATSFRYDPKLSEHGLTKPNREVTIGDNAFRSAPWLAMVIEHEVFHARQYKEGRGYESRIGEYLNELEVRDHALAQVSRFGLSRAEVEQVMTQRRDYWDRLPLEFQDRVARGDYTLRPGEDKRLPGWEDTPPKEEQ